MFTIYAVAYLLTLWLKAAPARLVAGVRRKRHRSADGVTRVVTRGRHRLGAVATPYVPRYTEGATSHHAVLLSPVPAYSSARAA